MGNCLNFISNLFKTSKIHQISGKKVRQIKLLAEGGYGYIVLAEEVQTGKKYALKKMICQNSQQKQHFEDEVSTLKELSHCQHVIRYFGSHVIQRQAFFEGYILMELGEGTVFSLLLQNQKNGRQLTESQIVSLVKDIAKGLKQMHQVGFTHRDVKVQNVLFVKGKAKLCDLGSSSKEKVNLATVPKAKIYQYQQMFQKHTTMMYRPPQMIDIYLKYPVDERVDTWMLGCVVFVINYHFHPFQEAGKLSIVNAAIRYPKTVSTKMQNFIRQMITPNPHFRPRMGRIVEILQNWQNSQITLNEVAKRIKQNQQYELDRQYDKIAENQWRNLKNVQQWNQFQ